MAAAASGAASTMVQLRALPGIRTFILSLTKIIHEQLFDNVKVVLNPRLTIHPVHFVIKGGAAAEIHLGSSDYTDIDTGLYISPDFTPHKRRLLRTQAVRLVVDRLIQMFQTPDPEWVHLWGELEAAGFSRITIPGFQNRVIVESTTGEGYVAEPAFAGKNGVSLQNDCPFGIWIRENVTAGPTPLGLDLISVIVNVNVRNIHHRVVLDIAIPFIKEENAYSDYALSEPVLKTVVDSGVRVEAPVAKPLSVYVDQYAASRSPEINAGKTARRAARAGRILTNVLTPALANAASPIYKNMKRMGDYNYFVPKQKLPSRNTHPENTFSTVVQRVRNVAPTSELRTPPPVSALPMITGTFVLANNTTTTGGGPGTRGGGSTSSSTRRIRRRRRGTQRRK